MTMTGIKRQVVAQHERALVLRNGVLEQIAGAGVYRWLDPFDRVEVQVYDLTRAELKHAHAEVFRKAAASLWDANVQTVETGPDEAALISFDGRLSQLMGPESRRFFWIGPVEVGIERVDLSAGLRIAPRLRERLRHARTGWSNLSAALRAKARAAGLEPAAAELVESVYEEEVADGHVGLLIVDGRLTETLAPGLHAFWNFARNLQVELTDLRAQALEVQGQEILTRDKVSLRINLSAHYRVLDAAALRAALPRPMDWLYRELQFALRQAVGGRALDELLAEKGALEQEMHGHIAEQARAQGMQIESLGLKDIILPGDMKEIMNQVVQAEKTAQANLIRRREETAATRSLLNTAKLMEQNPLLLRLKELETLERVTERVGSLTLFGGLESVLQNLVQIKADGS
mgnify:CR=1 FL=1